jgi:hypothetical protein
MSTRLPLMLAALLLPAAAPAAVLQWPVLVIPSACGGTLQACINSAAAGDTILIGSDDLVGGDGYTAIDESIRITRSLTLAAAPGIDAVFGSNRNIEVDIAGSAATSVAISDLVLRGGAVGIVDNGTAAGNVFRVERVRVQAIGAPEVVPCAINIALNSPSPQAIVGDNTVRTGAVTGSDRSGICVVANTSPTVNVSVFRNRVFGSGTLPMLFGISVNGDAGGSVQVSANTVLGPRLVNGIAVQRAAGSAARTIRIDNNVVSGQDDANGWGLSLQAVNADVRVVNNSVVHGARGLRVTGFNALPANARVANNLVAFQSVLGVGIETTPTTNANNLVFAAPANDWTPGPGTVSADPQLVSRDYPRPASTSPTIGAGNNVDVPGAVLFDADGERRIAFGVVDIGAHEANGEGAARIVATDANRFFNEAYVTPFPTPLLPADRLIAVALTGPGTLPGPANLGVYGNTGAPGGWSVFLQDSNQLMPLGARFHVLAPVASKTGFLHQTSTTSISGDLSTLDHPELNARPFAIAIALQQWQGNYHDVPIGLDYTAAGGGRWRVRNEDGSTMPTSMPFNIAVAPFLSPNAFRSSVGAVPASELRLDHPLLDDNPCATPVAGRVDDPDVGGSVDNPVPFALEYRGGTGAGAPGHWYIRAHGTGTPVFPARAAFNVIVDGAQANRCRAPSVERVFADGFET